VLRRAKAHPNDFGLSRISPYSYRALRRAKAHPNDFVLSRISPYSYRALRRAKAHPNDFGLSRISPVKMLHDMDFNFSTGAAAGEGSSQ